MPHHAARLVAALAVAALGAYLGVSLAIYSEADDAPGGVLLGLALIIGSLVLGLRIARRRVR